MADWKTILPAVASFIGGPAGTLAAAGVTFLADKLGASEKTVEGVKQVLAGMSPADLLEAKRIDIQFQEFCLDNEIKLQLGQIGVNAAEAASSSLFVAGWRPAVGWICGAALAYSAILEPLARFAATVLCHYTGAFPAIDTTITMQVLFGMLGLAGARSFDKAMGTAAK